MPKQLTREELWEVGAQFGHQTKRWNPKMKPYIYGVKNKVHIMDLHKTILQFDEIFEFFKTLNPKKGKILFVGTKKASKEAVREAAERTDNFYVDERWLGGTLTNLKTINKQIKKLWSIERDQKSGKTALLTKKEQLLISKKYDKLEKFLGGIRQMRDIPQALFVTDVEADIIAIKEAHILNIPVIGICDSNVDPDLIDYVIPANDDHFRSVNFITQHIADLYAEAMGMKIEPPKPMPPKKEFVRPNNWQDRRGPVNHMRHSVISQQPNYSAAKSSVITNENVNDFNKIKSADKTVKLNNDEDKPKTEAKPKVAEVKNAEEK